MTEKNASAIQAELDAYKAKVGVLAFIGALFILFPAVILLRSCALYIFWGWYVVPTFGIAALTLPAAFGLNIFASMFYKTNKGDFKECDTLGEVAKEMASLMGSAVGGICIALFLGWLGTLFL